MEEVNVSLSQPKKRFALTRSRFYLLLLLCFCFPLFLTLDFALSLLEQTEKRSIFILASLAAFLGGAGGWYLLQGWERKLKSAIPEKKCEVVATLPSEQLEGLKGEFESARRGYEHQIDLLQSSVAKSKEQVVDLNLEIDKKLEEMRLAYLEFEDLRKEYTRLEEEYDRYKAEIHNQLNHKDSLLADYQHTILEQRGIIEKKQRYISKLEGKVRDLMYEIRSLLQLEDPMLDQISLSKKGEEEELLRSEGQKRKPYDLSLKLNRYLDMAENFTGADHLGGRFLDSSVNRYAIDLRPLFDHLRDEAGGILFVYSQFENRFLFVNNLVKTALGWSGEKFIKEFQELVIDGYSQWQNALKEIPRDREKKLSLTVRTRAGEALRLDCYMGLILKGPFANHIIGMMMH